MASRAFRTLHQSSSQAELITELAPGRTRLTLTVDYTLPFGPFGRLAAKLGVEKLAQRETGEALAKLKALLEEHPASTAPGSPR